MRHNSERAHVRFIHVAPLETSCGTLEQRLWKSVMDREDWRAAVYGVTKSQT